MASTTTRRAVRGIAVGVVAGAVVYAIADAVRPRPGPARFVDWDEVARRSKAGLPQADALDQARRSELAAGYNRLAAEVSGPFFAAVGEMPAGTRLPPFEALDRPSWIDLNVAILAGSLAPVLARQERFTNSRALEAGRALTDRYVGVILRFLACRVLGQYDPQLLVSEPATQPGLYLVEPNIAEWEEEAALPGEALRRWLILHEMTHAWQFAAHPWLRDHLNSMLQELLGPALDSKKGSLEKLAALAFGSSRPWGVISRVQATMSLIEGYSNLVMDTVGSAELPEFGRLEEAYRERSGQKTMFELAFWKLTGLEMKLQQYEVGERFCRAVHEARGMEFLNRAWEGPANLPNAAELRDPGAWVDRVAGRPLSRASQE